MGLWYNGITSGLQPEDRGSIPRSSTEDCMSKCHYCERSEDLEMQLCGLIVTENCIGKNETPRECDG